MKNLLAYHGFYVIKPEFELCYVSMSHILRKSKNILVSKIECFSYVRVSIDLEI